MDFKKKLKTRLYFGISYIILGLALIVVSLVTQSAHEYLSPFGTALLVIGIVRVRNHIIITKNDETIKKQQIRETDERNIAISNKAKSISFSIYILATCVAIIVLQILRISELATILGGSVCALLVIYWVSYFIIHKKS